MTCCDLPSYLMVVRASALASNSGSYNSTAHAPACIQAVKLGGACNGARLSPARELLKLRFAGSWFIPYGKSVAVATFHIGATTLLSSTLATRLKCSARGYTLPAICPKNVVPQRRANPETEVVVVIMMTQMVLLQPIQNAAFHREMMDRVMNGIVTNVAPNETGPDCRRGVSEKEKEQAIKDNRQRNAHRRRHDQPLRIIWIIMVNTMDNEVKLFPDSAGWLVVKSVAMNHIFEQSPDGESEPKPQDDG